MLSPEDFKPDQDKGIDRLYEHNETMLVAPKGFGKCVVGFTAIHELINNGALKRVLVLSTAQVCTQVWAKEGAKWSHLAGRKYVCLTGESKLTRQNMLAQNTAIVICNFENLAWLMSLWDEHPFDGLLVDEITKLKAVGGAGYKKLRTKLKFFTWRSGMTADPVAQENIEIYGQMLIIDQGARLGRNRENFKRKYFMQMDYLGHQWDIQPGGLLRLTDILADVIYTVNATDYNANLPELIDHEIEVQLPEGIRNLYETMVKDSVVELRGVPIEAPNAAILQGKLHQMCCGTIYNTPELTEDELAEIVETGTSINVKRIPMFLHDAKMIALRALLKTIDSPVLIMYQFDYQRDYLIEEFGFPVFSAKNNGPKNDTLLYQWEKGDIDGMLIHPKSASHGLNFQYGPCHTLICLSYLWSADEWEQIPGRLVRQGQKSPTVDRYTIFCRNTVEDCVMKPKLLDRQDASELFHDYLRSLKG